MSIFKFADPTGFFSRTAKGFAAVSGLFCFVISVVMIANYIQLATVDPLDNEALTVARALYIRNQNDVAMGEQIRILDLMARKAYFTRRWQLRTGGIMLLAGLGVFFGSLRVVAILDRRLPSPAKVSEGTWSTTAKTRIVLLGLGLLLAVAAGVATILAGGILRSDIAEVAAANSVGWTSLPDEVAGNWAGFRGPGGNGIAPSRDPPVDWDVGNGTNVLWQVDVPLPGMSSPVVWDNAVFLTGSDGEAQEAYRYDTESGELIWTARIGPFPGSPPELADLTGGAGYAAPTGATDGERLFVIFASGDMACVDFSGTTVWGSNLGYVNDPYGHSSSLLVYDSILIVQYDHGESPRLAGYDTRTGSQLWRTEREVYDTWSSPVLVETVEGMIVVVNASPFAAGYDPRTGEELWRVEDIYGEVASSPAYAEGRLIIINQLMSILGIDAGSGESFWESFDVELPDTASPLAYDGRALIPTAFGAVTLISTDSGEIIWRNEFPEGFYASPILAGELIYLLDRAGVMRIIRASDQYELVGSPVIGEPSDATPAIVHDRVYIRGSRRLFCIGAR